MLIRDVRLEDAEGVLAVLNPIILAGCWTALDTPFTLEQEIAFIQNFPEAGIFHVAVGAEGQIVGFQNVEPFASYTHAFDHVGVIGTYVDLGQLRRGVASTMITETVRAALAKGYEKLFAFVRADNPAAFGCYRRHGFKVIGTARRHAKLNGVYVDEILIEKLLT